MINSVGIVAIYAGANGLLLLALSYNVGRHRDRTDSLTPGAMGDDVLARAIRAHGNAAEYMPLAIVMMLILALLAAPISLLHGLGALFTFGRVAQAFGMSREKHPNAIRFTGNLCTGLVYLIVSIACIYNGLA
jgi:uncharacterized membrane protein YecN with MAPEG domain